MRLTAPVVGVVFWEDDPKRTRIVNSICKSCQRGEIPLELSECGIVSPRGIAHLQEWDGGAKTKCGKPADGLEWWWRL